MHIGTPSETIDAEKEFLLHPRNPAVAEMAYVDSRYVYQDNRLSDHPPIWGTRTLTPLLTTQEGPLGGHESPHEQLATRC